MRTTYIGFLFLLFVPTVSLAIQWDFDKPDFGEWTIVKVGPWLEVAEGWEIEDGLMCSPTEGWQGSGRHSRIVIGEKPWKDYEVEIRYMYKELGGIPEAHAIFRFIDENNLYTARSIGRGNPWGIEYFGLVGGNLDPAAASDPNHPADEVDEWYGLKVMVEGDTFAIQHFDGKQWNEKGEFTHKANDHGGVGLGASDAVVVFDYLRVDGEGIPPTDVSPQGNLATTWGRAKL